METIANSCIYANSDFVLDILKTKINVSIQKLVLTNDDWHEHQRNNGIDAKSRKTCFGKCVELS